MDRVWAITIKGEEKGVDGVNKYLWATEKQYRAIMDLLQDESKQSAWVTLNDRPIQVGRIKDIKPMKLSYAKELPSFSSKVLKEIEAEKRLGGGDAKRAEGLKRLGEMKEGLWRE